MTGNFTTVTLDHNLEDLDREVSKNKINGDSVDNNEPKVPHAISQSHSSLLSVCFNDLVEKGIPLSLVVKGGSGSIRKVIDTIGKYGGRVATIVTSRKGTPEDHCRVDILIYGIDRRRLPQFRREVRGKVGLLRHFEKESFAQCDGKASA